jgi:hypothetical protein
MVQRNSSGTSGAEGIGMVSGNFLVRELSQALFA